MPPRFKKFKDFKFGVVNAIEPAELPTEAVEFSRNFYFRENFWRKMPGLTELHATQIAATPVIGMTRYYKISPPKQDFLMVVANNNLYRFDPPNTFTQVASGIVGERIEFLQYRDFLYYGSVDDRWRMYSGGSITYPIGGQGGLADDAPRMFSEIVFNPHASRFFGIGEKNNPDLLYFSNHTDENGIAVWSSANVQIIESVDGDGPQHLEVFEGKVNIFCQNSIHSGTVLGVPQIWSFQREKSQTGAVARRSVKRFGNSFLMLTPNFEVYRWPEDIFITKGRVKLNVDPLYAHLASAEIDEDRYYHLTFRRKEAVSSNFYHTWVYDILGDRWYGPSTQRNVITKYYDTKNRVLLMGGVNDLEGFVFELRGRDIKNQPMDCRIGSAYSDFGFPNIDKRFKKGWIKTRQHGSLPNGSGPLELIIDTDNLYNNSQSQRIVLEDPAGPAVHVAATGGVKEAVTKRFDIYDQYGFGNALRWELRHQVRNAECDISEIEFEYYLKKYMKEDRAA